MLLLLLLLLRVLNQLTALHKALATTPQHSKLPPPIPPLHLASVPKTLLKKAYLTLWGATYLVLSRDKITKKQLRTQPDASELHKVDSSVRLIFVRHGESVWNLVFNRGFKPSFLWRLASRVLYELYLVPFDDSVFVDSPLSDLGQRQCAGLADFLRKPCIDKMAQADFDALTKPSPQTLLVSSQLRRCVSTISVALAERLAASDETLALHSSCQEISRNFDTQSLAPAGASPALPDASLAARMDGALNAGNKSLSFRGIDRVRDFAQWATRRSEKTIVVSGHSLWFRSFFQLYLPTASDHVGKTRKIINCGAVALTLERGMNAAGEERYRVDPRSIVVVYGGFSPK